MNEWDRQLEAGVLHPIGVVARRTGLTLHVLRAWERRYGVVVPVRTAGGQRLYSDADVERLRLLRELTDAGRSISQIAGLKVEELRDLAAGDVGTGAERHVGAVQSVVTTGAVTQIRESCLAAGERMDGEAVHAALTGAVVSLRPQEFLGEVLIPLLHEVGEMWHAGQVGPAQEHTVTEAARRVLSWMLEAYAQPVSGPLIVATTPSGEQHELGAMAVSAVALDAGWRVAYLGPSLPAAEIARAARRLNAAAVALSVVNDGVVESAAREMLELGEALPEGVTMLVGGRGAEAGRAPLELAGARVITDLDELRSMLSAGGRIAGVSA
ncbi:MAG TPA: MerR family transcriptional regulator [Longimicrobiales bacterium]|nr:MerR family transcriptional regulator [Longimicrobiales bacterium]